MKIIDLDVAATRNGTRESLHRVSAAVVDAGGTLVARARDAELFSFWRSCAKPFQVMPLLESNGFDELRWGDDQLALSCASHGGEPEHVAIVEGMLNDIGFEEGDLACGPHEPMSARGARLARDCGIPVSRLHNNCSGKHAAMLARAVRAGWPAEGYERDGHPVQEGALDAVARWCGVDRSQIARAVDGCGVVVFGMPLLAMARAYAAFITAAERGDEIPSRIVQAMATRPFLVGGTERFDTVLMEETDGNVVSKVGAEGMHSVAVRDARLGIAVKVEDGAQRAQYAAVVRVLQRLHVLPDALSPRLADFLRKPIRNTRGELVGDVAPVA